MAATPGRSAVAVPATSPLRWTGRGWFRPCSRYPGGAASTGLSPAGARRQRRLRGRRCAADGRRRPLRIWPPAPRRPRRAARRRPLAGTGRRRADGRFVRRLLLPALPAARRRYLRRLHPRLTAPDRRCRRGRPGVASRAPQCQGSRCNSGTVLATVTGERTPTTPLVADRRAGKVGASVDPGVRRPAAARTTSFHEAWKKGLLPHDLLSARPARPPSASGSSSRLGLGACPARALLLYLIAQDNGAVLASLGDTAHEFFHDARHRWACPATEARPMTETLDRPAVAAAAPLRAAVRPHRRWPASSPACSAGVFSLAGHRARDRARPRPRGGPRGRRGRATSTPRSCSAAASSCSAASSAPSSPASCSRWSSPPSTAWSGTGCPAAPTSPGSRSWPAIGFGIFALLPALKIPANPPAVGDPGDRRRADRDLRRRPAVRRHHARCWCPRWSACCAAGAVAMAATATAAVVAAAGAAGPGPRAWCPDNPDTIAADVPAVGGLELPARLAGPARRPVDRARAGRRLAARPPHPHVRSHPLSRSPDLVNNRRPEPHTRWTGGRGGRDDGGRDDGGRGDGRAGRARGPEGTRGERETR